MVGEMRGIREGRWWRGLDGRGGGETQIRFQTANVKVLCGWIVKLKSAADFIDTCLLALNILRHGRLLEDKLCRANNWNIKKSLKWCSIYFELNLCLL